MATNVFLDFETRSTLDVKKVGSHVYAAHPSTSILCLAYAVDTDEYPLMTPEVRLLKSMPDAKNGPKTALEILAANSTVIFHAHNAGFEQAIWQNIMVDRYGFPPIPIERWRCTAAKAASFSLPRSLEGVGAALGLAVQKDKVGHQVMLKLSKPRFSGRYKGQFWEYDDCPQDFEALYKYCIRDVEVEREVDRLLPDLSAREQRVWFIDQKINQRGVYVDIPTVHQISDFIETTREKLASEFLEVTDGEVPSIYCVDTLRKWLARNGCDLPDLSAPRVEAAAKRERDPDVRRALEIRRDLSKTSVKKYPAILARTDTRDSRLRENFLYYAAITGRWGGRGVQLQNLPRGTVKSDTAINLINGDDYGFFEDCYSDPMAVYSSCIRGVLTASPGNELYVCDYSAVEARVLAWLAGDTAKLDVFREGKDLYCVAASQIFGCLIGKRDKVERGAGKVSELALGYNGGINAYAKMAVSYHVDLNPIYDIIWPTASTAEQEKAIFAYNSYVKRQMTEGNPDILDQPAGLAADVIKQRWRCKNVLVAGLKVGKRVIVSGLWDQVEAAATEAVLTGEKRTVGGRQGRPAVTFGMLGAHLLAKLPSGNCLVYPFAEVHLKENDWGQRKATLSYKVEDENTFQYGRKWTYGGRLVENITQAVSRDLMAAAMPRHDDAGFALVLHAHDELGADQPKDDDRFDEFCALMAQAPPWAQGLPVGVEGWRGLRYRKA